MLCCLYFPEIIEYFFVFVFCVCVEVKVVDSVCADSIWTSSLPFTTAWNQTKDATLGYAGVGDASGRGDVVHPDVLKVKNSNETANIIL